MTLEDRIGIDVGRALPVEEAIAWAARHGVLAIDVQVDLAPNALASMAERAPAIRAASRDAGVTLALHTLSAVNIAEVSPFMADAVDRYLESYIEAAVATGAAWVVVHAGYHFTGDYALRREASLARLQRAARRAEERGVTLLLENMNREPDTAEVHYLGATIEECRHYFGAIASPALGWSFTVNHAHLYPEGIGGFLAALPFERCREVRIADCRGTVEEHLRPGEGTIDFKGMFEAIEGRGFEGHYTLAFGSLDDMLDGRRYLARAAAA
jgi:sugar phosphate isomerase/epimerase